jgi:cystathionine beta-lyase/cystathionine gamma-synthase
MQEKLSTKAVHGGEERPNPFNSIAPPIFQTAIYSMDNFDQLRRYALGLESGVYLYSRSGNPTLDLAARKVAELEGAEAAVVTASGTSAIFTAIIALLEAGDQIISMTSIYGGTYRLMRDVLPRLGIRTSFLEDDDLGRAEGLISERARMIWVESPTNPLNRVIDLREVARLARRYGLVSVIDNTLASPANQRPLEFGLDLVVHSATKYLAGHSDLIAGAVCGRANLIARIRSVLTATGAVLDPLAAALLIRGIKTLEVRVRQINQNALALASFLNSHPRVLRVHYAGLQASPYHELARRQMTGFGGIITAELEDEAAAERFCDALKLIKISTSLGGVETVVTSPVYTSHAGFSQEELSRCGVTRGMVRFSVGIEDAEDLIADVARALEAA